MSSLGSSYDRSKVKVRVNGNAVTNLDSTLNDGDRVSFSPAKLDSAI
jgi:hypothetical protein